MPWRNLIKRAAFALLGSQPAIRMRLRQIGGADLLTILSLHRVAPMDGSTYPPLDPALFRELIDFCTRHFSVVTFGELAQDTWRKPPLILSFDDGYKDFAQYSAPIMAERGVRCNLNLIPSAIESGLPPFNVILNDYAAMAPDEHLCALDVPGFARFRPGDDRYRFGNALSTFFKDRAMDEQRALAQVIAPQLRRTEGFVPTAMMTLDESRSVAATHEIGAHSFEHANLGHESDDYVSHDARRCRAWFADKFGFAPDIYAVPNGDYRPGQLQLIAAEGFTTLLLVGQRFSSLGSGRYFRFNFDASNGAEMRFKALGGIAPIRKPDGDERE